MTTTPPVLPLPDAERLAEQTLAKIDPWENAPHVGGLRERYTADRERVASDLVGLRRYWLGTRFVARLIVQPYAEACSDGLRRTAALYGVTDA